MSEVNPKNSYKGSLEMSAFAIASKPYLYQSTASANLVRHSVNLAGLRSSLAFLEDCPDDTRRGWSVVVHDGDAFKGYAMPEVGHHA